MSPPTPHTPTPLTTTPPPPRGFSAATTRALDGLLEAVASRRGVGSAVMGVASLDGERLWLGARGEVWPGGPAMSTTTPFFIASITKLYIAALILRLEEEGYLRLEDPLPSLLDPGLVQGLHVLDGTDHTQDITVAHLLAHASGLPDFIEDYPPRSRGGDRRSLVEILVQEGDRSWTLEDTVERVRSRLVPHFPPSGLDAPRVRIRYTDTGFQLLIGIVETCSGLPFHQALSRWILEPLRLRETWLPGGSDPNPGHPAAATLLAGSDPLELPRFLGSIGDLNATAQDLLRFMSALVTGTLFARSDTAARMQARWNRFSLPTDRGSLRQAGWPIEYGYGMMRFALPRLLTPFRPVPPVVGHSGSTGTWLFHEPGADLLLVGGVSQLAAGPLPYRVLPRVLRILSPP